MNLQFHRELPIQNRLKGCVYNEKKISYFLNPTGWAKPLDGSDGDAGVRVPEFYMCDHGSDADSDSFYSSWVLVLMSASLPQLSLIK